MKGLHRWTGEIKNKFLIWMLTIGIVPLILLGTLSFAISYKSLMSSYRERIESNLYITQQNLKSLARSIESISRQILASSIVSGAIESTARAGGTKYVDARTQRELKNALQDVLNYTDIPATVYLLDEDGFFFRYANGLATANAGISLSSYRDSGWYRDTLSMNGLECYFLTNVMTGRNDGYVSVTKLLRDLVTGKPYGTLVINISSSELDGLLPSVVEQKGITYVVIDSKGETLRVIGNGARPAATQALLEKMSEARGDSIAGYGAETRTGWEIRCLLDNRTVMLANIGIPLLTLFFALGLVIVSLACSLLAARSITQPLKRLGGAIAEMRAGSRLNIGPFGDDEVGRIGNALIEMAAQKDALSERLIRQSVQAKEAELKALQAQINPHFLYNTLSSIYWLAKLGMSEQAAQAAVLLSENFKYVTAKDGDMVTVEDELSHVEHYIEIQNIRYNRRIDVTWDVDKSLYGAGMLKFVLQPIIENAIHHGLEPKIGQWELSIVLRREGNEMVFKIIDNGVGMDVASARKGYGMRNVHERICLKFGEAYGCTCESRLGEGTTVSIRMPYSQGVI